MPSSGHALDQQARRDTVVGGQHQDGIELFGLAHVVLDHVAQALQARAVRGRQGHDALVRLLAGLAVLRIERDRAAALSVAVDQIGEVGVVVDARHHLGRRPEGQVGLGFGHGQLDRPVALDLQFECTVELDAGLHQQTGRSHLAEQVAHRQRPGAGLAAVAARQHFLPGIGQPHDLAADRQAFEDKGMKFRHT